MQVIEREEQVTVKKKVYVAKDGKEFKDNYECYIHEKQLDSKEQLKKLERYIVPELDEQIPLHDDASYSECFNYTWFKVNNEIEFEDLKMILKDSTGLPAPTLYPAYVCFETEDEFEGYAEDWSTSLEYCMKGAKDFFTKFNYDIEFKRKEN